jgi:lactoylglutathione lyase
VETIEEVQDVQGALSALGAEFLYDGVVPHGEGVSSGGIFFTDPDGIRLEVYAPSGADTAPAPSGAAPTCGFF